MWVDIACDVVVLHSYGLDRSIYGFMGMMYFPFMDLAPQKIFSEYIYLYIQ